MIMIGNLVNYERLVQFGIEKHNIEVSRERAEIPLLYFGSIIANISNIRLENNNKVNFFAMNFLPSGAGKDFGRYVYYNLFRDIVDAQQFFIKTLCAVGNDKMTVPDKIGSNYSVSIESSDIGLYLQALGVQEAGVGSLNIEVNEFADYIGRAENLRLLKELYDGELKAKLKQGDENEKARIDISGIGCNSLIYGSPDGIKGDRHNMNTFKKYLIGGMSRRSIIYYENKFEMNIIKKEPSEIDCSDIVSAIKKRFAKKAVDKNKDDNFVVLTDAQHIPLSQCAIDLLEELKDERIDNVNKMKSDDLVRADLQLDNLIKKVATIVAMLNLDDKVTSIHIKYVDDLIKRTRKTVKNLLKGEQTFNLVYNTLTGREDFIDMVDLLESLHISDKDFNNSIDIVNQLAYRDGLVLVERGDALKQYKLEEPNKNDLSKIIISISADNKKEKSVDFRQTELPFFGDDYSLEQLVKSSEFESFTTCHFKPSSKTEYGHRKADNFIKGQNLIALDIDNGLELETAKNLLSGYTYIIYTTKSHGKENKGDRFRILLPSKHKFEVTPEQHKSLYENITDALGINAYDIATRNVSRIWYTNPEAQVYKNEAELLDIRPFLPETKANDKIVTKQKTFASTDKRLDGFMKWFFATTIKGNRNDSLFRLKAFCKDIGLDHKEIVKSANKMLDEPLKDSEVEQILKY